MGRWNIPSQPRDAQLLMLVRTRVPLDRLIPTERDGAADITAAGTAEDDRWEDFRTTLENARGCDYAGCGRVAEDLEKVLFVITWRDQAYLDEFRASPEYAVFLMRLGFLDVASESPSLPPSSSSTAPSLPSVQIIKFQSPIATSGLFLSGWISWYTVALPIDAPGSGVDVDVERDQLLHRLQGPRYPSLEERGGCSNVEWYVRLVGLPRWGRKHGLQYGWVQEARMIEIGRKAGDDEGEEEGGEGGNAQPRKTAHTVEVKVQDGVIYQKWVSQEAEEALKAAIPEVDMNECWEKDLREVGAMASWEEHVMLVRITRGRKWRPREMTAK